MVQDPLRKFPGYALRRASNAFLSDLTPRLAELDLRLTEASILTVIRANPNITQSEIGKLLSIASANVAPIIGRLDERGLLERVRVDGRSHGLCLTDQGSHLAKQALAIMEAQEVRLLQRIPPEHRDGFVELINGLWDYED